MKKKISIIFIVFFTFLSQIQAQKTAFEYLKNAPAIPASVCSCSEKIQQDFESSISAFADIVTKDARKRARADESYMEQNKEQIKSSMMKEMSAKSGMSQQELEAMKNKKMSKEDKQAMANKMLQQYNLSMDEVKNMKNMDDNAKKAWAQSYATGQMAKAKAKNGNTETQSDNDKATSNIKLLQEQGQLRNQIASFENEVQSRYNLIMQTSGEDKLDADLQELNNELRSIKTIYECNECPEPPKKDKEHWNAVIQKIHDTKIDYCRQNTPKFIAYLNWYKENLIKTIPVYDRAEEIQYLVTAYTTNTQLSFPGKGNYSITAVEGYLSMLKKIFIFKTYKIENFNNEFYK